MIPSAGPQYVTVAVPLMTVLLAETWRRKGAEIVTGQMILWSIAAWLSMIVQEVPWAPIKLIGPMTLVLLVLAPPGLALLRDVSRPPRGKIVQSAEKPAQNRLSEFPNSPA